MDGLKKDDNLKYTTVKAIYKWSLRSTPLKIYLHRKKQKLGTDVTTRKNKFQKRILFQLYLLKSLCINFYK
jgi:hypothetical protein